MYYTIHLFLLLSIITLVSGAANNSYQDCLRVAARFATTVSNGPVADIRATPGVNVTCPQLSNVSCPGSMINGVCVFAQKLAVTCINGSTVRIRVQSNGLPRRCASVPLTAQISERNTDFEVNFNPDVSINAPNQAPTTAAALNAILCNISSQSTVPTASAFTLSSNSVPVNALAGVAVDGVNILNVNSLNNVDPFFPNPTSFPSEGADQCLSHPAGGGEYHYHIASGCMVSPPSGNLTNCSPQIGCLNNVGNYSISMFSSFKTLTVIGIAKDGHVIYGPYTSGGVQVTSGFDICNGMFYDSMGNYGYFATNTFPYVTGCFGPGNYPSFKPNCTTNPASSYTMSSYAVAVSTSTSTTTATTSTSATSLTTSTTVASSSTSIGATSSSTPTTTTSSARSTSTTSSSTSSGTTLSSTSTSRASSPSSTTTVSSTTSNVATLSPTSTLIPSSAASTGSASSSTSSRATSSTTSTGTTSSSTSTRAASSTTSTGTTHHISTLILTFFGLMMITSLQ